MTGSNSNSNAMDNSRVEDGEDLLKSVDDKPSKIVRVIVSALFFKWNFKFANFIWQQIFNEWIFQRSKD